MLALQTILLLLPLLVQAAPKYCKKKASDTSSVSLLNQALVATGGRHRWGRPTTTAVEEAESTAVSEEDEGEDEVVEAEASIPTRIPSSAVANSAVKPTLSSAINPPSSAIKSEVPPVSSASPATNSSAQPSKNCECGYILSQYDNVYFPKALRVSFDSVSDVSALAGLGLDIQDGSRAGSVNPTDGRYCQASAKNVAIQGGALTLTVPGGQASESVISGAEIETSEHGIRGGVFTMNAKLSDVPGTCQALFTYTSDQNVGKDELDIEMVHVAPGLQLTNHDPEGSTLNDFENIPFPNKPAESFNEYTIGWLKEGPKYFYNGAALAGPTQYPAVNPSKIVINNWSNSKPGFTAGPPLEDTVLQVKSIAYYYQTEPLSSYPAYPAGCSQESACVV